MPEANSSITERIVKLEVMAEHADNDRKEMKDALKAMRDDVAAIKSLVEQVRGGVKVAWIAYGLIGAVAAGIGWLVSKIPWGSLPR